MRPTELLPWLASGLQLALLLPLELLLLQLTSSFGTGSSKNPNVNCASVSKVVPLVSPHIITGGKLLAGDLASGALFCLRNNEGDSTEQVTGISV